MYQTDPTKPLGRRRSISAARQAEVFRQHYAAENIAPSAGTDEAQETPKPKRGRKAKADK